MLSTSINHTGLPRACSSASASFPHLRTVSPFRHLYRKDFWGVKPRTAASWEAGATGHNHLKNGRSTIDHRQPASNKPRSAKISPNTSDHELALVIKHSLPILLTQPPSVTLRKASNVARYTFQTMILSAYPAATHPTTLPSTTGHRTSVDTDNLEVPWMWVNQHISLTWIKDIKANHLLFGPLPAKENRFTECIWGWFPLRTMSPVSSLALWARYERFMTDVCGHPTIPSHFWGEVPLPPSPGKATHRGSPAEVQQALPFIDGQGKRSRRRMVNLWIIYININIWIIYGSSIYSGWWLSLPLWKIWKSIGMIVPNIWKNKKCSKPPTRISMSFNLETRRK